MDERGPTFEGRSSRLSQASCSTGIPLISEREAGSIARYDESGVAMTGLERIFVPIIFTRLWHVSLCPMAIAAKQRCCDCRGVDALLGHRLSVDALCSLLVGCGTRHAGNGLFRAPAKRWSLLRHSSGKHARRLMKEMQAATMPVQTIGTLPCATARWRWRVCSHPIATTACAEVDVVYHR